MTTTLLDAPGKAKVSLKAQQFSESVIRQMSRLATQHQATNLAQGFPDFSCPAELKTAAIDAINGNINQYPITWGDKPFRDAVAEKTQRHLGISVNPETEITVTCGSTEGMVCAFLACVNPGDEVIVFEPFYENYGPDAILAGATPRYVKLHAPHWTFDPDELAKAFNNKTKAIVINTPNNPTGKVFTRDELHTIAQLCQKWDVLCFTDEIYEHILYDGAEHVAMHSIDGMRDRTVTINALSKTYSVTGWRVGYLLASPEITGALRTVHDFLTIGAPAPLQRAGVTALQLPQSYYDNLLTFYASKRAIITETLDKMGLSYTLPQGAYYVFADITNTRFKTDWDFANYMVKEIGVAVVPGSSFFLDPAEGNRYVRFCFSKTEETLRLAQDKLLKATL